MPIKSRSVPRQFVYLVLTFAALVAFLSYLAIHWGL